MEIINSPYWGFNFPKDKTLIISGPCSAETEEQVLASCIGAQKAGVHLLRAGIWKPRTRPNSFEGVGSVGLAWLKKASKITGLPCCVEVANAKHVQAAINHNIDILWLGARTTVNPFAVQEIADALKGIDIPVMIKNPINPDINLWFGAIERLYQAGIKKQAVIHRGFSVIPAHPYRNRPKWEIVIELRRQMPQMEIICDPSHICGNRHLLASVSQKALDLNLDGLMIESHINPDEAWSDAKQQITPTELNSLLNNLVPRFSTSDNPVFLANMEALRMDIDNLDREIIELLAKRMEVVREIGHYKKANNIAALQVERWDEIFKTRTKFALQNDLTERFVLDLIQNIHKESIRQQTAVMSPSQIKVKKEIN